MSDKPRLTPEAQDRLWCEAWIDGFTAAAALMSGHDRDYYERSRDEYLERRGWTAPVTAGKQ